MNTICTIYRLGPTHWYGILRLDREKEVVISGTSLRSLILRAFEAVAEGSANRRERSMQEVITYLEQVSVPEGARYWIQSAIRHLREGVETLSRGSSSQQPAASARQRTS